MINKIIAIAAFVILSPAAVWAQEYQKFDESSAVRTPAAPFVVASYGFIWAAVLVYVIFVARALTSVRSDIEDLRRKIERATSKP